MTDDFLFAKGLSGSLFCSVASLCFATGRIDQLESEVEKLTSQTKAAYFSVSS